VPVRIDSNQMEQAGKRYWMLGTNKRVPIEKIKEPKVSKLRDGNAIPQAELCYYSF